MFRSILPLVCCSILAVAAQQTSALIDALAEVQALQSSLRTNADPVTIAVRLRTLHADTAALGLTMNPPPAGTPTRDALSAYAAEMRAALEQAERNRPGSVFQQGRIEVTVSATTPTLDEEDYRLRNLPKTADALNLIPGVSIQKIGNRNERGVYVRGFDFRQVPLYMDGIPVYVPYDGYVDLDRFLTYDVSEIQVSKGFTSPLFGPNALGGAINMISKAPNKPFNLDLGTGYASGDQVHGFANVGARFRKFWLQGGFATLQSDTFPLSGNFRLTALQPDRDRRNAWQSDSKGRVRFAWTPKEGDQYTFTYAKQTGEKGNPPYAGTDAAVRPRFWRWPQWDKESFYFIGDKKLGETGYVRARLFYDKFNNLLRAYDNANYNSQTLASSFTSPYDDDTYGTSSEAGIKLGNRHNFRGSFYFKDDTHREGNLGEPLRTFRDQSLSIGAQDTIQLTSKASVIAGFSADRLDVLNAQNLTAGVVTPFPVNTLWAFNPQMGAYYALSASSKLHATYAHKTRLPTIKDRYSYRLGQAIPNPDLRPERSDNFEIGVTQTLGSRTFVEASLFRSNVSDSTQRFFVQPNVFQLRNLGQARYQGGELGFRTMPLRFLQWTANYTYLSRRNQTQPNVIQLDTPRHKTYSMLTFRPGARVTAFADFAYEGGRWNANDSGRVQRAPSFGVFGLGATARLYREVELQTGVNNLGDRNYFLWEGYPEAGRNYFVNLRYRF
ncbi:TonB-dependent receptor [Bryobacterales bacterium F-183]|nr:TonB-dependent receptor [Bryobacterales bacterium F-183]